MGGTCTYGGDEKFSPNFIWKTTRDETIWRSKCRWEDNIRMNGS